MNFLKISLFLVLFLGFIGCEQPEKLKPCTSKEACLKDPNCACWCSVKCGWRKKRPDDHPVYIEKDPHGKHCYCKQWDFDHYEDNCVKGKNISEPAGAQ